MRTALATIVVLGLFATACREPAAPAPVEEAAYVETGDLGAMAVHGRVRVLVTRPDEPHVMKGRDRLADFAVKRGLKAAFIEAPGVEALASMLVAGQGDVVLEPLPEHAGIARTRPVESGSETYAWSVRAGATALLAALDQHLVEQALTQHGEETSTGDLDAIRRRGSLRMLTENSPLTYYLHQGQRSGFDYELMLMAARSLGVRLEVVVAPTREWLVPWLLEGKGDVVAASFGVSESRAKRVAFTAPYLRYDEVVVQAVAGPRIARFEELRGQRVAVRPGSSTEELLSALEPKWGPFVRVPVPDDEPRETIDRVARGEVPFAIVGSHALQVERTLRDDVEAGPVLPGGEGRGVAFAVRPENPALLAALEAFVREVDHGLEHNMLRRRYFENRRVAERGRAAVVKGGRLSPWDESIRRWSAEYRLDWRLMAAQAFQESRFDPKVRSHMGATGLFQLMPVTARSLGFRKLDDPEESAHAGILYMHKLLQLWEPTIPLKHRLRFALAAYNVGPGHVFDAQRLAGRMGLDPAKWFGHVEKAMLLLEQPRHHRLARNGYCRGREPVRYVSEIQNRYDDWVKLLPP